jgi:drug/metabolite transporter, DME family
MELTDRNRGILYCLLASLAWSTGGLMIKLLPQDAFTILFYRSLFTSLFFLAIYGKQVFNFNKKSLLTALFYLPMMGCFVMATKLTTAANAIFLQSTYLAYVLILEPYLTKTKMQRIDIIAVVLSFIGMMMFVLSDFDKGSINIGILIAMGAGIATAGVILTQKRNDFEHVPSGIFMGNMLVVLANSFAFINKPYPQGIEWGILLFLGFIQLGVGYLLFAKGQRHITAFEGALIALVEPILNPIWVMIGYGEIPSFLSLVGGAIIIFAIMLRLSYIQYNKSKI